MFPPERSLRLIADIIAYTVHEIPRWNPINICSYHLQEAGATPEQELTFALSRRSRARHRAASGQVSETSSARCRPHSFFVDAGVRFVEETPSARVRAAVGRLTQQRYGVTDPKMRRFRYGVQVDSLGLTEAQPENDVQRIVLEMLGVTLPRTPAPGRPAARLNEALGLPRPWDQQWSLRLQQVLAFESDLLEYDDIFDGSTSSQAKVGELVEDAAPRWTGSRRWGRDRGRRVRLHEGAAGLPHAARGTDRVGRGEGRRVNVYETSEPRPDRRPRRRDPAADPEAKAAAGRAVRAWKARATGRRRRGTGRLPRTRRPTGPDAGHPRRCPRGATTGVGRYPARGLR